MILGFYPDFDLNVRRLRQTLPAIAFFGGFLWDALTIGRSVGALDLWLLTGYLAVAAALIRWLGWREALTQADVTPVAVAHGWRDSAPYLLLQFFFGGLFSALFIFYFKSSSHLPATLWALSLGALLVANEFLEEHYRRFTLTWALFGLCAILLLNFVIPHLVGSVAGFWFFASTLAGAALTQWLHLKTPRRPGRTEPVWAMAVALLLAYTFDLIPPVPLVKRDIAVGHGLTKVDGHYLLRLEKTPWWIIWRRVSSELHLAPGERIYCVSAIFAPSGLSTRLYHRWQHNEEKLGWQTYSHIGFNLVGGREAGYRGYTYKQNLAPGTWRVRVETENGRTVAMHDFEVAATPLTAATAMLDKTL